MSSEDKRIVILEFDNSKFDKNVEKSNETLEKLKKNLKLDGASDGLESISKSVKKFSLDGVGQSIGTVTTKFTALEIIGKRVLENLTDSAMRFGSNLISSIVEPIKTKGWQRALNLEQAEFMLEGLLGKAEGGAEKIEGIMNAVKESVSGTAYGMDEAAKVASQLVASGVEDSEQMLTMLRGIAGTAAMTGGSFADLGDIFTTVAGNGRVMTEQLRQFSHRGLNVAAELAKQLGKTEAEIRDMVSKGEIDFMTFANAMSEAFGEHATKANETYTGSLSNMRAALARIGADVATPALKNLRDLFNTLRPLIDDVHKAIMPLINALNTDLTNATEVAIKGLTWLDEKVKALIPPLEKESKTAKEASEDIADSADAIEQAARDVLANKYGNGEERRKAIEALGLSYERVQNKVNELCGSSFRYEVQEEETSKSVKKSSTTLGEFRDKIHSVKEEQQKLNAEYRRRAMNNFLASIKKLIVVVGQYGRIAKTAFDDVFNGNLSKGIHSIAYRFRQFTDTLKLSDTEAEGLRVIFLAIFNIGEKLLNVASLLADKFFSLVGVIPEIWGGFLDFIASVNGSEEALQKLTDRSALLGSLSKYVSNLAFNFDLFRLRVKQAARTFLASEGFKHLYNTVSGIWSTIKSLVDEYIGKFTSKFEKLSGIKFNFDWIDNLSTWLSNAAENLAKFIDEARNGETPTGKVFQRIGGVIEKVSKCLGDFRTRLRDAIREIKSSDGFKHLQETFSNLWETLKDIVGGYLDKFINKLDELGKTDINLDWIDTVATWISTAAENLATFVDELLRGEGPVASFLNSFSGSFSTGFNEFVELLTIAKDNIVQFFSSFSLSDSFNEFVTNIQNMSLEDIGKSISDFIDSILESLSNIQEGDDNQLITNLETFFADLKVKFDKLKEDFSNIDWEDVKTKVKAAIQVVLSLAALFALGWAFVSGVQFIRSLTKFMNTLSGGLDAITKRKTFMDKLPGVINSLSKFVVAIAGSLAVLSLMDPEKLKGSVNALMSIMLSIAGIMAIIGGINVFKGKKMEQFGNAVKGFGIGVALLVASVVVLGNIKAEKALKGIGFVTILLAELVGAIKLADGVKIKAAASIVAMAVAVDLLVLAVITLGKLDAETGYQGAIIIGLMILELAAAARIAGSVKAAAAFLGMAIAVDLLVPALIVLGLLPFDMLMKGAVTLGLIMLAIGAAARIAGRSKVLVIVGMAVTLGVAIYGLMVLSEIPMDKLLVAALALGGVLIAIGASAKLAGSSLKGVAMMLALCVPLGVVAYSLYQLAQNDWMATLSAAFSISRVFTAVSKAIAILSVIDFAEGIKAILILDIFILSLVAVIAGIGGLFVLLDETFGKENIDAILDRAIEVMSKIGTAIGEFVWGILNPGGGVPDLGQALEDFGAHIKAFGEQIKPFVESVGQITDDTASKLGTLAKALLEITAAELLDQLTKILGGGNILTGQSPLELFGKSLEALGTSIKAFADNASSANLGNITTAVETVAGIFPILKENGISGTFRNWLATYSGGNPLQTLGVWLFDFSNKIAGMPAIVVSDIENVRDGIAVAVEAYKKLDGSGLKSGFGSWLATATGGSAVQMLGEQLAGFSSNVQGIKTVSRAAFISIKNAAPDAAEAYSTLSNNGIKGGLASILASVGGSSPVEMLGERLKGFSVKVQGIMTVNRAAFISIKNAAPDAVAAYTAFGDVGITGGLLGIAGAKLFGDPLSNIGEGLKKFSGSVQGIQAVASKATFTKIKEAAAEAVGAYKAVNNAGITGGVVGDVLDFFTGDAFTDIGGGLKKFAGSVQGMVSVDDATITNVGTAIKSAVEIFKSVQGDEDLDTTGGFFGALADLASGNTFSNLGTAISNFATALDGMPDIDTDELTDLSTALPDVVTVIKDIKDADITTSDVSGFGEALISIGTNLVKFSMISLLTFTNKIKSVAEAIPSVVSMTDQMSNAVTTNVESYSETLVTVGENLKSFANSVSGITPDSMKAASESVAQIAAMQSQIQNGSASIGESLSSSLSSAAGSAVTDMSSALKNGSSAIHDAVSSLASKATEGLKNLAADFRKSAVNAITAFNEGLKSGQATALANATILKNKAASGVSSLPATMKTQAVNASNAFASNIGSKASTVYSNASVLSTKASTAVAGVTNAMRNIGSSASNAFASAIGSKANDAYNTASNVGNRAKSGAQDAASYDAFRLIGHHAMNGFIIGFADKANDLYNTAYNIAANAARRARNALDIKSPSRVFYEIGDFAVQGFINAFSDGARDSQKAGESLALVAVNGTKKTLDVFQNAIDSDLDLTPTITPVLDLSNIRRDAGLIGSMLYGDGFYVGGGILGNLATIGGYTSDNGDVVNAINGLKGGMGNTTFNITVDGSTSPEEFVDELVRIVKNRSRF